MLIYCIRPRKGVRIKKIYIIGRYRLSNGELAKALTRKSEKAVIFRTDDELYLFAVNEQEKLIEIASKYVEF